MVVMQICLGEIKEQDLHQELNRLPLFFLKSTRFMFDYNFLLSKSSLHFLLNFEHFDFNLIFEFAKQSKRYERNCRCNG